MVDFKKHLAGKKIARPTNPIELYDTLDRAHDKGPLRPAQLAVLQDWFANHRTTRDIIVKLHTGQGKTLIGLLMLQSRLNESKGPVVYLCPNNFLIAQTCEQAAQFGISTCTAEPDLPAEFLHSQKILVTSVQKLFNGLTRFGLGTHSIGIDTLLMDDAHACTDAIRDACRIRIPKEDSAYASIRSLFDTDLEQQGLGTHADLLNGKREAFLPVPYWAWLKREGEVARILSGGSTRQPIKFAWPLLKDLLGNCQCVVSGTAIEIEPYNAPLVAFGSYWKAAHRIFMSATVTDDAFLVKGLQLSAATIVNPLSYDKERWSGEKMILLPSLIHETFDRATVVKQLGKPRPKAGYGIVALVPSAARTTDWESYGAVVADKENVVQVIGELRKGDYKRTVILVNRYDGIDLPDNTCRILVFDGKPFSENLIDLYQEHCRPDSEATLMRSVRTIEQGMGRSVRGEKDYSVIIVLGDDLIRLIREKKTRKYLSPQMATQLELGLEITDMARKDIEGGEDKAFTNLIAQCINRDEDWKIFYAEQMDRVTPVGPNERILKVYETELAAEQAYASGDYASAVGKLQALLDAGAVPPEDKCWYLQEMARYQYRSDRSESERLQVAAHKGNRLLLKAPSGVTVAKLVIVSKGRVERISKWVSSFSDYNEMQIALSDITSRLVFGVAADKFEQALDELSRALGFAGERPDKEWKEGPDNLWALDDRTYILWECKSEVDTHRKDINKAESEQMNKSGAWFGKHYAGVDVTRILIHPASTVASAAAFTDEVGIMTGGELRRLVKAVRDFFKSFEGVDFKDLSSVEIQKAINAHGLSIKNLTSEYIKKPRNLKS